MSRIRRTAERIQAEIQDPDSRITRTEKENIAAMHGKIVKGIAGFYYVHIVESGGYECNAKGIFSRDGIKALVGDDAEIESLDEKD